MSICEPSSAWDGVPCNAQQHLASCKLSDDPMHRHKGKAGHADDVIGKLQGAFVAGFTQDPLEFLGWLKEQAALDDIAYGKPVTAQAATSPLEVRHAKLVEASSELKVCSAAKKAHLRKVW